MKVILLQDVKTLGKKGDIVDINEGYARNFVLPKKLGLEANNKNLNDLYEGQIHPMFGELYEELLRQAKAHDKNGILYRHHMNYVRENNWYDEAEYAAYEATDPNQIVVDYLASMTDDYFIALYHYLFPKGKHDVKFTGYFD